jgi:sialate O-acetylesterase
LACPIGSCQYLRSRDHGVRANLHGTKVKGGKAPLSFDQAEPGLVAPEGKLKGFAVAEEDSQFVWAEAAIEGDKVVVWSDSVKKPVAVRYGWADNPICNLYSKVGLPVSLFRTDSWPGITAGKY